MIHRRNLEIHVRGVWSSYCTVRLRKQERIVALGSAHGGTRKGNKKKKEKAVETVYTLHRHFARFAFFFKQKYSRLWFGHPIAVMTDADADLDTLRCVVIKTGLSRITACCRQIFEWSTRWLTTNHPAVHKMFQNLITALKRRCVLYLSCDHRRT